MTDIKRIYSLLGLAAKAGKIKSGEFSAEQSVKAGRSWLVLVADDASDNTKKKFNDMCTFYHVPCIVFGTKEDVGHWIGKEMRASVSIEDQGFAASLQKLLNQDENISQRH